MKNISYDSFCELKGKNDDRIKSFKNETYCKVDKDAIDMALFDLFRMGYDTSKVKNNIICTHIDGTCDSNRNDNSIECGNFYLCRAIAAINDDNDYLQYFIKKNGKGDIEISSTRRFKKSKKEYRKCTVDELIEHYQKLF